MRHATALDSDPNLLAVRECLTLDEVMDLAGARLMLSAQGSATARSVLRRSLQLRYEELRSRNAAQRPLRDLVGPPVTVIAVRSVAAEGVDLLQLVAEHPTLGRTVVVVRANAVSGRAGLAPGARVRFGAAPTRTGLSFRAHVQAGCNREP